MHGDRPIRSGSASWQGSLSPGRAGASGCAHLVSPDRVVTVSVTTTGSI